MARLAQGYLRLLERYPLKTQALSTGVLMGAGDVIAQFVIEGSNLQTYTPSRTARFFIFGTFVGGPALRGWYLTLEKLVKFPGAKGALGKMACDQLMFAPVFCGVFLSTMGYWRSGSLEKTQQMLKESYVDVIISNYKLWPAVQILNFYFIPLQHRVLFVNCIALIWNTYLAWRAEMSHQRSNVATLEESIQD